MRKKITFIFLTLITEVVIFQLACLDKPDAPTGLNAEVQQGRIALVWKDNSDNEYGFNVYRRPTGVGDFVKIVAGLKPNTVEYVDSVGLDKDYEYKVSAYNRYGESFSNAVRARTAPNAPSNLTITNPITGEILLTWQDNSQVEDYYVVERKEVGSES